MDKLTYTADEQVVVGFCVAQEPAVVAVAFQAWPLTTSYTVHQLGHYNPGSYDVAVPWDDEHLPGLFLVAACAWAPGKGCADGDAMTFSLPIFHA